MNRNIYLINKTASSASSSELFSARTFKGDTRIIFDFSNVIENDIKLIKIQIDFNDGTTLEKVYSNKTGLFDQITHLYSPSTSSYITTRRCNINLVFSNFTVHNIIIPINIAQCSFLSEYGALSIKKAQFIDNANIGDMFLILESEKHNLYNVCVKTDSFSTATTTVTADDKILVTNNSDPIVTNFNDNFKV